MSEQIFPAGTEVSVNKSLLYTYTNRTAYDEMLLSWSVVYCSALPGSYAGPYACVRTASQPIRSKNSFRISISVIYLSIYLARSHIIRTERSEGLVFSVRAGNQLINSLLTGYRAHVSCDKASMSRDKECWITLRCNLSHNMIWMTETSYSRFATYGHILSGPESILISKPVLV